MRRGFTLVELLVVTMTLPFVVIVLDLLFSNLVHDIPRLSRVVQENTTVINMLERMRGDVDSAKGLPRTLASYASGDKILLIELAEGTVCYELREGEVVRFKVAEGGAPDKSQTTIWSVPNSNVSWRVWERGGRPCAVEVSTSIRHKLRQKVQQKMSNSHVYFAGALGAIEKG